MILISHRGNIFGPCSKDENTPDYIINALNMGFHCEIDVWSIADKLFLGHDKPQYEIYIDFLLEHKEKLWVHCKNAEAFPKMLRSQLNCFFHDKDTYTLTSYGYIWGNINSPLHADMICVMPEKYATEPSNVEIKQCKGICSDYIFKIQSNLNR